VVLYGGGSPEHDVSRQSARTVVVAGTEAGLFVDPVGITRDGTWLRADDLRVLCASGNPESIPEALPVEGSPTSAAEVLTGAAPAGCPEDAEVVVFPAMHGPLGEDGTVQGVCELAGVAYVGSGVLSSSLCMDKAMAKTVLTAVGIPQPRYHALHLPGGDGEASGKDWDADELMADLGSPVFVKPANMGSSVGVSRATTPQELRDAVALAASYDPWVVIEEAITGREIECGVLGATNDPRAGVPGEVIPAAEFFDFADKYHNENLAMLVPADLAQHWVDEVKALAKRTFTALRCDGLARVDFFLEEPGRGLLVNEVNTIPGFTAHSMYPRVWRAEGLPPAPLVAELVRLGLERHHRQPRRTDVADFDSGL
jgi:D-alanine-D-alanine ligase